MLFSTFVGIRQRKLIYKMSIQITGLSKTIDKQLILNNISFEIATGEIVGFLGPNGAGKTTTMRILTGSLGYDAGSVRIDGMEVKTDRTKTNALIGYLPENNPLYPDMYVREYLHFVAGIYGIKADKKALVEEIIEQIGLLPEAHKKIKQLSKGYKQRVGLAQAILPDPKVLILDEPTTGLDPNQLEEIRSLIKKIGKDKTILLSTHILQEVKALCNRVILIHQGEIAADFKDINQLDSSVSEKFCFEVELLKAIDFQELAQALDLIIEKQETDLKAVLSATYDFREALFDKVLQLDNKLMTIKPLETVIEDVFKHLTQQEKL